MPFSGVSQSNHCVLFVLWKSRCPQHEHSSSAFAWLLVLGTLVDLAVQASRSVPETLVNGTEASPSVPETVVNGTEASPSVPETLVNGTEASRAVPETVVNGTEASRTVCLKLW